VAVAARVGYGDNTRHITHAQARRNATERNGNEKRDAARPRAFSVGSLDHGCHGGGGGGGGEM